MANLIYLCGPASRSYTDDDLRRVAARITPENAPSETRIVRDGDTAMCLVGDAGVVPVRGTRVCMGQILDQTAEWAEPGTPAPEGTYAIVRDDAETVELCSDIVGSRSLYYRLFEDLFVAATSQRAVMHFADAVEFEPRTVPWMVASGTLGHHQAWDGRVELLPPDSRLRLDRSAWECSVERSRPSFSDGNGQPRHEARLGAALGGSCNGFDIDTSEWVLPLSGGVDSRALLLEYRDADGLETVTWGTADAPADPDNDAAVARDVAAACDVPHSYYELPTAPDDVETVFERFLTAGEGRIDHVGGYVDGFETFSSLAQRGVNGIIRGDVAQSQTVVKSPDHVRVNVGARLLSDYADLASVSVPAGDQQAWPDRFGRRTGESLSTWRDRVYQQYRIPYVLAPLSDLKLPYLEIVNPLLTHRSVEAFRELPDEARTGKRLFGDYVRTNGPDVRIAESGAVPGYADIFGASGTVEYLHRSIDTDRARSLLGTELVEWTLDAMGERSEAGAGTAPSAAEWSSATDAVKYAVANTLPSSVTSLVAAHTPVEPPKITVDPNHLAFRLYLVVSMVERLERDTEAL